MTVRLLDWSFAELTFLRKRGQSTDYEFDLVAGIAGGLVEPLDVTGATVEFRVMGPVDPARSVQDVALVIAGTATVRAGEIATSGRMRYTPSGVELELVGEYLAEAWVQRGSVIDKVPHGDSYWRVVVGQDARAS